MGKAPDAQNCALAPNYFKYKMFKDKALPGVLKFGPEQEGR
jgi:hypothetical protein